MCSFLFLSMIKSIDFSWIYCLSFTVVNERGNCLFSSVKNTRRFFRSKLLTQSLRIKCADCGGNHTASLRGCTLKMLRYITHLNLVYFWKFPFLSNRLPLWRVYLWFALILVLGIPIYLVTTTNQVAAFDLVGVPLVYRAVTVVRVRYTPKSQIRQG